MYKIIRNCSLSIVCIYEICSLKTSCMQGFFKGGGDWVSFTNVTVVPNVLTVTYICMEVCYLLLYLRMWQDHLVQIYINHCCHMFTT